MGVALWPEEETLGDMFTAAETQVRGRDHPEGRPAPDDYRERLPLLWPKYFSAPFADHHDAFWGRVNGVGLGDHPPAIVAIWGRGGAKSTSAEGATADLGVRGRRRYALYVCSTQAAADKHVMAVADMLESEAVARHYPEHADRAVNKYGQSKGWRRERLATAGGFVVDGIGLDVAVRGVKFEEQRPDLIILDDIDDKHDTPVTTAKKIETLTTSILPAGATGQTLVIAIQNLITADGFFTRLADGRADYLHDRVVIGPHPALDGMEVEWEEDAESGARRPRIVAGEPTWAGQDVTACQQLMDHIGYAAFMKECQHDVKQLLEGLALRFDAVRHLEDMTQDEARRLAGLGQAFGGIDFGDWRFGFNLRAVDTHGVVHQLAEYFSQREDLTHRARVIWCICQDFGLETLRTWGDAANPQDIRELNRAFGQIGTRLRVAAVLNENKARSASVERKNTLLARDALRYRRDVTQATQEAVLRHWKRDEWGEPPDLRTWRQGYNAASHGVEMTGSRLLWEVQHWKYPIPREGEAQKQDPDDHSADGADLIAADRYAIMSWWKAAHEEEEEEPPSPDEDTGLEAILERAQRHEAARRGELRRPGKVKRKAGKVQRRERP